MIELEDTDFLLCGQCGKLVDIHKPDKHQYACRAMHPLHDDCLNCKCGAQRLVITELEPLATRLAPFYTSRLLQRCPWCSFVSLSREECAIHVYFRQCKDVAGELLTCEKLSLNEKREIASVALNSSSYTITSNGIPFYIIIQSQNQLAFGISWTSIAGTVLNFAHSFTDEFGPFTIMLEPIFSSAKDGGQTCESTLVRTFTMLAQKIARECEEALAQDRLFAPQSIPKEHRSIVFREDIRIFPYIVTKAIGQKKYSGGLTYRLPGFITEVREERTDDFFLFVTENIQAPHETIFVCSRCMKLFYSLESFCRHASISMQYIIDFAIRVDETTGTDMLAPDTTACARMVWGGNIEMEIRPATHRLLDDNNVSMPAQQPIAWYGTTIFVGGRPRLVAVYLLSRETRVTSTRSEIFCSKCHTPLANAETIAAHFNISTESVNQMRQLLFNSDGQSYFYSETTDRFGDQCKHRA